MNTLVVVAVLVAAFGASWALTVLADRWDERRARARFYMTDQRRRALNDRTAALRREYRDWGGKP